VLLEGETGSGKELAARVLHGLSPRREGPFIEVDCGAIPENLIESELFGHEKGAFTGATSARKGVFELADGGTLFLDEVANLPLKTQNRLLRVLQERRFRPIGGEESVEVDVRVVAASNRSLREAVREGSFREDLFYRLYVYPIRIPPLRNRREDIPSLASFYLEKCARDNDLPVPRLPDEFVERLTQHARRSPDPHPGSRSHPCSGSPAGVHRSCGIGRRACPGIRGG
jgi:transcriptional regulator with GAF, ATPase, and Fis domain